MATPRSPGSMLLAAAAVLVACGDTLVDHRAKDLLEQPTSCLPGTASCSVGSETVCLPDSPARCGASCEDCTTSVAPPAGGEAACLPDPAGLVQSACGYQCTGGLLKCSSGCCTASALAAGAAHTCAVTAAGALYCWGENEEGQVTGISSAADVLSPRKRFESGVTAVAAGVAHTCAAVGGEVRCFGRNVELQAPDAVPAAAGATSLAAGAAHTCAVVAGGVLCWGDGAGPSVVVPAAQGATALAAGDAHTCAVVAGGRLVCWGENDQGQLGDGTFAGSASPVEAIASGAAVIAAGGRHTCAAAQSPATSPTNGNVTDALRCWGDAPGLPFMTASPQPTPEIPMRGDGSQSLARNALARLSAGRTHTCFQEAGDFVQCVGSQNNWNQLGDVPEVGREATVPGTLGVTAFASGADHSCAVFPDGGIRCWGLNASGQLGDGTNAFPGGGVLVPVLGR